MQTSIYYIKEDNWLLEKVQEKAQTERRSRSAVILAILEEYFSRGRKIGEILYSMGHLSQEDLIKALKLKKQEKDQLLGEILIFHNFINRRDLKKALAVQQKADFSN